MNNRIVKCVLSLLGGISLSACTINHYHVSAANPSNIDDSLLVVPEATKSGVAPTELSEHAATAGQTTHSAKIDSLNFGLTSSRLASPEEVLKMSATGSGNNQSVHYMDSVGLEVQSEVDAYLNCYHEQADGSIIKVFPNRYSRRYWVYASQQLSFPDEKYFDFLANTAGATEGFICLISQEDVLSKLPAVFQAAIFQKLPVKNFDAVYALYKQATNQNLAARVVSYTVQQ